MTMLEIQDDHFTVLLLLQLTSTTNPYVDEPNNVSFLRMDVDSRLS